MKSKFWSILVGSLFATTLSMSVANAFVIDTLLGSARLANSGDATELAYLKSVTGDNSLTLDFKVDSNDTGFNFAVNGPDSWFIDVGPNTPGYFMLKFGVGNTPAMQPDHFVFQNAGELNKLVWSNSQVDFLTGGANCPTNNGRGCNIGRLSHYVGTNGGGGGGGPNQIPEPAGLLLLCTGLIGLAYTRRRTS